MSVFPGARPGPPAPRAAPPRPAAGVGSPIVGATMRAPRKTRDAPGAELLDVPVPRPGPGEVLVRVHGASICGTDLHILEWNEWAAARIHRVPLTFGHELAAIAHDRLRHGVEVAV